MTFRLRDDLYWCAWGGRVVFLDIVADRYFCLSTAAETAFARVAADEMRPGDADALHRLIAQGLLIEDPASAGVRPATKVQRATRDYLQEPCSSPRLGDVVGRLGIARGLAA